MTRDQAEEIWMANQVGYFRGSKGELAMAVLILSQPVEDELCETKTLREPGALTEITNEGEYASEQST